MTSSAFLLAAVFGLGGPELLLIFALMLLLFGAKKLPDLAKGLGKSIKEFKKASHEAEAEEEAAEAAKAAALESKKPEPAKVGHSSGAN